jgi:hypothetical protein
VGLKSYVPRHTLHLVGTVPTTLTCDTLVYMHINKVQPAVYTVHTTEFSLADASLLATSRAVQRQTLRKLHCHCSPGDTGCRYKHCKKANKTGMV